MKINGISLFNVNAYQEKDCLLYQCLVIKDGKFLGNFKQGSGYSDYFSFDKNILQDSMDAFKMSKFFKKNCFDVENDLESFYTPAMFISDLIDIYLDEQEFIKTQKEKDFQYFLIAEEFLNNKTVYATANTEQELKEIKKKISQYFKVKYSLRIYQSLTDFLFDNREFRIGEF